MSVEEANALRKAQNKVNSGSQMKQDAWMTYWCQSNWGELLQPAPMSISILGTLVLLVQGVDDFDLRIECKDHNDVPFVWDFATTPDSFKGCLMQMVTDGTMAFVDAHTQMECIETLSNQVPFHIKSIVEMLLIARSGVITRDLPLKIATLAKIASECSAAGRKCQESFRDLCGLAGELAVASQRKLGNTEKTVNKNAINIEVIKASKVQQAKLLATTEESLKNCARDFLGAQDLFQDASKNVPKGWDIVGMNVVESAMNVAVSAANAYISTAAMGKQLAMKGANIVADKAKGGSSPSSDKDKDGGKESDTTKTTTAPVSSIPTTTTAADPGISQIHLTISYALAIKDLAGGKNGEPNWDQINTKDATQSGGGNYILQSLETQATKLEPSKNQMYSGQLLSSIQSLTRVLKFILESAGNSTGNSAITDKLPEINETIERLTSLKQSAAHATQSTGNISTPLFTSEAKPSDGKTSTLAVEAAKNNLSQCRSNLEGARASYQHVNDEVVKQQNELTKMITEMAQLDLVNQSLKKMVPILIQAVGSFTLLQSNISQMVRFFDSVSGLLNNVMTPYVEEFTRTVKNNANDMVAGISLDQYSRNMIHQLALMVSQVSMLAEKISGTYCKVSTLYIMPEQKKIGKMLGEIRDTTGNLVAADVRRWQKIFTDGAKASNQEIVKLVAADQETFMTSIEGRLKLLDNATSGLMDTEVPQLLKDGNMKYIEGIKQQTQANADNNPMLKSANDIQSILNEAC